jgi:hypothetical protein
MEHRGYSGRLIAEHLWHKYGKHRSFKLAIAGRDLKKLQQLKAALDAGDDLGILIADSDDLPWRYLDTWCSAWR